MKKKNLHQKVATNFFGSQSNLRSSLRRSHFHENQFANVVPIYEQPENEHCLKKNHGSKEDFMIISCNAGFRNMKKCSRSYNKSTHEKIHGESNFCNLVIEGAKCLLPQRQKHFQSQNIVNRQMPSINERKNNLSVYSTTSPYVPIEPDLKQINFVINSIRVGKVSFGKESYSRNSPEEKENRLSFPNKISESNEKRPIIGKLAKPQRIRPSTSQPSLENKFFLTSK